MIDYVIENWLQILGVTVGIIYLIGELRASIWMWVCGIIMPAISIFVYYKAGVYADAAINVYYFAAAVYGFCLWKWGTARREHGDSEASGESGESGEGRRKVVIRRTPAKAVAPMAALTAVLFALLALILGRLTDSTVPVWDAFTTALSVIGLFMLSRKWLEQWWIWFIVDVASCALYAYKGIYFYSGLYCIYSILAVYGYYKWKKVCNFED